MSHRSWLAWTALLLACGCEQARQSNTPTGSVPRPVMIPPRGKGPFDARQLVGMKPDDAIRLAEGQGYRCQVVGEPSGPPRPSERPPLGAPDPDRSAVILLEVQDGK